MLSVSINCNRIGERIFNYCGPIVWNKLPIKIREQTILNKFRKLLKLTILTFFLLGIQLIIWLQCEARQNT